MIIQRDGKLFRLLCDCTQSPIIVDWANAKLIKDVCINCKKFRFIELSKPLNNNSFVRWFRSLSSKEKECVRQNLVDFEGLMMRHGKTGRCGVYYKLGFIYFRCGGEVLGFLPAPSSTWQRPFNIGGEK
jgi:hypothetical protein